MRGIQPASQPVFRPGARIYMELKMPVVILRAVASTLAGITVICKLVEVRRQQPVRREVALKRLRCCYHN